MLLISNFFVASRQSHVKKKFYRLKIYFPDKVRILPRRSCKLRRTLMNNNRHTARNKDEEVLDYDINYN